MKHSVLFVCFGNTCRSPMATAIFKDLICKHEVTDQGCGTNARHGAAASSHAQTCMKQHGVFKYVEDDRAQQITQDDVQDFEFIFAMDENNMRNLTMSAGETNKAKIQLLGSFDPQSKNGVIIDPFGQHLEVYKATFQQIQRSCEAFFKSHQN